MSQLSDDVINTLLDLVKSEVTDLKDKMKEMEKSMTSVVNENVQLTRDNSSLEKRLRVTQGLLMQLQTKVAQQENQIIDLKTRSMRDNMVFSGIAETPNESWETTKSTVTTFMKDVLAIPEDELKDIEIDRAHRLGTKQNDKPRPIVAKFCKSSHKDAIFKHVKNLKGKNEYSVNEQLPPEIQECRKRLWPKYKEAKRDTNVKEVKWNLDKLIIDKRVIRATDDKTDLILTDEFTDVDIVHTQPVQHEGSSFIAHAAAINNAEDVSKVLTNLTADLMFAKATHTFYAYRIGRTANTKEKCKDDGDHGAGTTILSNKNRRNVIVVVSRWTNGKHIGPIRFNLINKCIDDALDLLDNPK